MTAKRAAPPPAAAPSDAAARAAALDTTRSCIVQAPAGSGKTELLIQRLLCLLAEVEEPEQVVAITFTRKATGEMRERVVEALRQAREGKPFLPHQQATRAAALRVLARDAERGWALAHSPARLRIFTIDALCASIVQRMPVTSLLGAGPEVTEKAEYLYARAARATVQLVGGDDDDAAAAAARRVLLHAENDVRALESLLTGMLARRDQWLRHVEGPGDLGAVRARLEQAMVRTVREELERRRDLVPPDAVPAVVALARHHDALSKLTALPGCEPDDLPAWGALREVLQTKGGQWRTNIPGFIPRNAHAAFTELMAQLRPHQELRNALHKLDRIPPPRFDEVQWEVMKALFVLLPCAVTELGRVFREAGTVDFIEIARAAQHALGSCEQPTDLALGMGHAIRHLLLDEFQDTSVTQFELLKSLTAGWRPGDGRTLFLVGDPMQSIFRFRQAEVGLFLDVWQGKGLELGLERLRLQQNFRSQQAVVDWVNRTFPVVFPAQDDVAAAAVAYTPCTAARPPALRLRPELHPFLRLPGEPRSAPDVAEAQRVVELIKQARERSPEGSVAILVRARSHLAAIVPALKRAGIAFRAVEIDCLAERPVVMDLVALTRALLHPADRPAWLSVLRAPWCGLTLADLLALSGAPPPAGDVGDVGEGGERKERKERPDRPALWERMQEAADALSPDGRVRLERVRAVFQAALERRRRQPLRPWVESVWNALGGPACLSGEADLHDATQFLELLEQYDRGGEPADLDELAARMKELYAASDATRPDAVDIMTIHGAKGLQFGTVLVPGLGRGPRGDDPSLLLWEERATPEGAAELLLAPLGPRGKDEPLYKYVQRTEAERGAQEARRLLYVAATRAQDALHLLGSVTVTRDRKEGTLKLGKVYQNSLLSFLWPVVQERFEAELAERERLAAAGPKQLVIPALAAAAAAETSLRRLKAEWTLPAGPASLPAPPGPEPERDPDEEISFRWVGQTARHVGTVTHLILQRMAREGLPAWDAARRRRLPPLLRALLANEGVTPEEMEEAVRDVRTALEGTLADPRGRWTLELHREAHSEYALSGVVAGRLWNVKIDRTFLDEQGTRWIVDYKASRHRGTQLEQFLDNEQARYREKLEVYAALLGQMEDAAPIRIGLYFPLLRAWRQWQPSPRAEAAPLGS